MTAIVIVCLVVTAAAWDAFRRYVETARLNRETVARIDALTREVESLREQNQSILSKLQAQQVARAGMSRIGRG